MTEVTASGTGEGQAPHSDSPSPHGIRRRGVRQRTEAYAEIADAMDAWDEPWVESLALQLSAICSLENIDIDKALTLVQQVRKLLDTLDLCGILDDRPMAHGPGIDGVALSTKAADAQGVNRSELAARLFGSSHALDENTALARWASTALRHRLGASGEGLDGRQLWEVSGIRDGQVSAPVLTWAVPAVGDSALDGVIRASAEGALPAHISLFAMLRYPVSVPTGTPVLVVENPRLVEAAAERRLERCVVATNGNPTRSVTTLLDQLQQSGASLLLHGDFDIWGIAICRRLSERFDCEPWMMDAVHYENAIRQADRNEVPLTRSDKKCGATPWDPKLKKAFGRQRLIVHEEFVLDDVLTAFSQMAPLKPLGNSDEPTEADLLKRFKVDATPGEVAKALVRLRRKRQGYPQSEEKPWPF